MSASTRTVLSRAKILLFAASASVLASCSALRTTDGFERAVLDLQSRHAHIVEVVQTLGPFDGFCLIEGEPEIFYDRGGRTMVLHFSAANDLVSRQWIQRVR